MHKLKIRQITNKFQPWNDQGIEIITYFEAATVIMLSEVKEHSSIKNEEIIYISREKGNRWRITE